MRRVAVIGGGVAGCFAATALAEAGAEVVLFEADPQLGGRFATRAPWHVDVGTEHLSLPREHGIHGIWSQYHTLRRELAAMGTAGYLTPARTQELLFRGAKGQRAAAEIGACVRDSWLPTPLSQGAIFNNPALAAVARAAGPAAQARLLRGLLTVYGWNREVDPQRYADRTVADLLRGWPPAVAGLFEALTHAGFFGDADQVDLAAFQTGVSYYAYERPDASAFDLLTADSERVLFAPLAERLRAAKAEIRLSLPVERLLHEGGRVAGVATAAGEERFDAVIATLPPVALRALAARSGLDAVLGPDNLPGGWPSVIVRLLFRAAPKADRADTGVIANQEAQAFFWVSRVVTPYLLWAWRTGGSAVELHLYGRAAREAATQTSAQTISQLTTFAEENWPELRGTFIAGDVQQNRADHVAFERGTFGRVPPPDPGIPGLYLAGDWVRPPHTCLYLERATVTGFEAARAAATALGLDVSRIPPVEPPSPPAASVRQLRRLTGAARRLRDRFAPRNP